MRRTRSNKLGIIPGNILVLIIFLMAFGSTLYGVISSTTLTGKDYFAVENSTLSVTNEIDAVKLTIQPTARTARVNYRSYIDSTDLSNFIKMQILPSIADNVDFLSMDIILQDSVDPTQQLLTSIAVQNVNGNNKTVATAALTDSIEYIPASEKWIYNENVGGYQYLLNTSQLTYGYDNGGWGTGVPQYTHIGTTLHGDSTWLGGYYFDQGTGGSPGSNNHYGYLKNKTDKECIPFTLSYAGKELKIDGFNAPPTYVNGYKIAKIDESEFLSKSSSLLPSDSPLLERYAIEHVSNLFSSGKVRLSIRFSGIQQTDNKFNKIEFRLKGLKGQDFTKGNGFSGPVDIANQTSSNVSSTDGEKPPVIIQPKIQFFNALNGAVKVTNEKDAVRLTVKPTEQTARINYLNYIDSRDLSKFISLQVLPSVVNDVDFLGMDIILEDSEDPTQQIVTTIAVQTVNGNNKTLATLALTDDIQYIPADGKWLYGENVGGFQYIRNTSQVTYGYDNGGWATGTPQYAHFGTTLHGNQSWEGGYYFDQGFKGGPGTNNHYGYLKKNASKDCSPFTLSYINKEMKIDGYNLPPTYIDGYKIAKIDDPEFIKNSTSVLPDDNVNKKRYSSSNINKMFSSGKVKLSIRFNGIQQKDNKYNEINVRLKGLKGQDFTKGAGIADRMPPILTASQKNFVTYRSFENMLTTLVDAFDADTKLIFTVKINDKPVRNISNYVFSNTGIYNISFTAKDSEGNESKAVIIKANVMEFKKPASLEVEINSEMSYFSTLNLSKGFAYTIDVIDTGKQLGNMMAENVSSYQFKESGSYKLRYNIFSSTVRNYGFVVPISVKDTVAPEFVFASEYSTEYELGSVLNIIKPTIKDNFDKNLTYSLAASVGNNPVEITGDKLSLTTLSDYKLTYTCVDSKGNRQSEEFTIHVSKDITKPVLSVTGKFKEKYLVGDFIELNCANANDIVDKNVKLETMVELDGKKMTLTGTRFEIKDAGRYTLTFKATDNSGNTASKVIKFEAVKQIMKIPWLFIFISIGFLAAVGIVLISMYFLRHKKEKSNE
jgi:hypothetical protein